MAQPKVCDGDHGRVFGAPDPRLVLVETESAFVYTIVNKRVTGARLAIFVLLPCGWVVIGLLNTPQID